MTIELLDLPDLPSDQAAAARTLVAVPSESGPVRYKAPVGAGGGGSGAPGAPGAAGQGFVYRGDWTAATAYAPYDVLTNAGSTYVATAAFTSGQSFATTGLSLWAAAGAPDGSGSSGSLPIASPTQLGGIKPGDQFTIAADGTVSLLTESFQGLPAATTAVAADLLLIVQAGIERKIQSGDLLASVGVDVASLPQVSSLKAGDLVALVSGGVLKLIPATAFAGGASGGGTAYATSFTVAAAASMTVGTASPATVTPGAGGWNGQTVTPSVTGISGTFTPVSAVGSGTAALTFQFTASAAGSGTLNAAASGMTSGGAVDVTVAAAGLYPNLALAGAGFAAGKFGQALTTGSGTATIAVPVKADTSGGPADQATYHISFWFKSGTTTLLNPQPSSPFISMIPTDGTSQSLGLYMHDGTIWVGSATGLIGACSIANLRDDAEHYVDMRMDSSFGVLYGDVAVDTNSKRLFGGNPPYCKAGNYMFKLDMAQLGNVGDTIDDLRITINDSENPATIPTSAASRGTNTLAIWPLDGSGTGI